MQSNHEAFLNLAKKISLAHMKQYGNTWKLYDKNAKFYCTLEPEIFNEVTEYGGITPYMIIYPVLLQVYSEDDQIFDKIYLLPIFCVRKADKIKEFKFFDLTGQVYNDVQDFIENNHMLPGKIAFPKDFHYEYDTENDEILIEWVHIDTEKKLDDMNAKRHSNWFNLIGTAGITAASIFALTCSGALPAFGVILSATLLYGDDVKCDPLENDPILKEGENSVKLFEDYHVLLPKSYEISKCTEMPNLNIQRKIIIIAGHFLNAAKDEIQNTEKLFQAINKEFGFEKEKWQVFCGNDLCLYDINPKPKHFMNVNIHGYDFVIFVPAISIPNKFNEAFYNNIEKQFLIKNYTELKKNKNITKMMENIALRLCTNNKQPKEIIHCMQDIFGGNWNCFIFYGNHSYYFTFNAYITLKSNSKSYCLFY
ncbi:uncharacterized protein LOC129613565 [Condylostylus longicornis]|uniref:uncharacterized protein LOC129613565 n=1 Tax=Condylostylus longicornis TaxID=2530218 RepID=UPI00244E0BE2|nr:uncharacterized protein LOC129613565 [Condylostylus longicornis]